MLYLAVKQQKIESEMITQKKYSIEQLFGNLEFHYFSQRP